MKHVAAFVAGVTVTAAVVLGLPGTASPGPRAVSTPRCTGRDLTVRMGAVWAASARGAKTPEEALRADVTRHFPHLAPQAFRKGASGQYSVAFGYDRGGRPLAKAAVEKVNGGWRVHELVACQSALRSSP